MAEGPVLRFAPSPNGRLHLGHAFSALFTARAAVRLGGTFLLRIEDIDPARSTPEFDTGILEDLVWLGLDWPEPVLRQSSRMAAYAAAAETLKSRGLLYPAFARGALLPPRRRAPIPAAHRFIPGPAGIWARRRRRNGRLAENRRNGA